MWSAHWSQEFRGTRSPCLWSVSSSSCWHGAEERPPPTEHAEVQSALRALPRRRAPLGWHSTVGMAFSSNA
eukprot:5626354-Prorocentrum_lima.AAC.1